MTQQDTTLFYYGDATTLVQLKRGYLPFQTQWDFLEPFIHFARWHAQKAQPVTEAEILEGLSQEYQKLPDNIRSLLAFEDFLQQRDKFEDTIRARISQQRTSTLTGYAVDRLLRAAYLRLFSSAVLPAAWQQFADHHQGVCVALRTRARSLQPQAGYPLLLKPVAYGQEHQVVPDKQNPIPGAFADVEDNRGLGEWRAVLPITGEDEVRLKLRKGDVAQIYLSVGASDSLVRDVQTLIEQDMNYRQCQLLQVIPDVSSWRLTAVPFQSESS